MTRQEELLKKRLERTSDMTQTVKENITWQDLCEIVETAVSMLGKNINEELMGQYKSPKDFYDILLRALCDREYGD